MFIRVVSDLHLEFYKDLYLSECDATLKHLQSILPNMEEDLSTVLIVGGDIGTAKRPNRIVTFLKLVLPRFKHVIYVLGNHEHYGSIMDNTLSIIRGEISKEGFPSNLTIAGNEPEKVEIDGITFLCGTLWTRYGGDDAFDIHDKVAMYMNDHRAIHNKVFGSSYRTSPVYPRQLLQIHKQTVEKIAEWMSGCDNSKTVVCTHHMPSFSAIDAKYMNDETSRILNHAFASDLDEFILEHKPAAWTFGHTHTKFFNKLGQTMLVCNPYGYPAENNALNGQFDPLLRFEV